MKYSSVKKILSRLVILCFLTVGLMYVVNIDANQADASMRPCCSSCQGDPGDEFICIEACDGDPVCEAQCQQDAACWHVCLWNC